MLASIIACVLVGVLMGYQVFKQGLFSAWIMAVLSVAAAMIAFDYYEVLSGLIRKSVTGYPTETATFLGLFIVSLLILRFLADYLIKGNMKFPLLVDRAGSAFFGLIAGLILVGMIALGFQMLPIPAKFLGYDMFAHLSSPAAAQRRASLEEDLGTRKGLFPYADGFVFSLVKHASAYGFSGSEPLGKYHPDLRKELYLNRLLLNQESASRIEAAPDALSLKTAWVVRDAVYDAITNQEIAVEPGHTLVAVQVQIAPGSGKRFPGASDADDKIRYVLSNFRLIGFDKQKVPAAGVVRYPLGFFQSRQRLVDRASLDKLRTNGQVEVLFCWPGDLKGLVPECIEFKRSARTPLPSAQRLLESVL